MNDSICVFRTFDVFKANLIKSCFDKSNIYCFVKTHDASGVLSHLGLTQGGIELMVLKKDLEKCKKIIDQMN